MNNEKLNALNPKLIGYVGVDSGSLIITDPLYLLYRNVEEYPNSFGRSCEEMEKIFPYNEHYKSFNYDHGKEGAGVIVKTVWGDGTYPVIGWFNGKNPRPQCITIDFNNVITF